VSVARVDVSLDAQALREHFVGLPAYRRTRFLIVVARAGGVAVLRVQRAVGEALFAPITGIELLAGPDETAWVHVPGVDTAIPSLLAAAAARHAPAARATVVQGRYEHVNFILDPAPVRIVVRDVVPPEPAKLYDQAVRVRDTTEELPPIELVPDLVDIDRLMRQHPAEHYLLPCQGSGGRAVGAEVSYLDQHPARADWTLIGCERSRQIHRAFYRSDAPCVELCPLSTAADRRALLTKCCLQEEDLATGPGWVSVPWGASLQHVREALATLARALEPAWAPA